MNKKSGIIVAVIIALIAVGGGSFYAGFQVGKGQSPSVNFQPGDFANMSATDRQAVFGQNGQMAGPGGNGLTSRATNGGFITGEIIAQDDTSITIKLLDGGSRIVFLADSAQVMKSSEGSRADLTVGQSVTVNGTANDDGSLTAAMVQLRPER